MGDGNIEAAAAPDRLRGIGALRIAIGLVQGLSVYFLNRMLEDVWRAATVAATKAQDGLAQIYAQLGSVHWLSGLFVLALLLPFPALAGLSVLRPRMLLGWLIIAAGVLFGLGAYLAFVYGAWIRAIPGIFLLSLALFLGHHLVVAAARTGKLIAPYEEYFDRAWKSVVQMALAAGFALAAWLILVLASELFAILGFKALKTLIAKEVFILPFWFTMFASAVHLTDQRADLVLGARNLGLSLLGWLTPAMAALILIFLALLPFGGLGQLWGGGPGSGLLIAAAIVLIVLVNCVWQDGTRSPGRVLGWSARLGAVLVAPLIALAAIGLSLRVADLGWTPSRIFVAAILLVLGFHGATYLWAARPGARGLLPGLGTGNVWAAGLATMVLLCLVSPLGDPARLAVADQLQRLRSGKIEVDVFDFRFLTQNQASGRWGAAALRKLTTWSGDARAAGIAVQARDALNGLTRFDGSPARPVQTTPAMTPDARRRRIRNLTGDPNLPDAAFGPYAGDDDPALTCREPSSSKGKKGALPGRDCQLRRLDVVTTTDHELVLIFDRDVSVLLPGDTQAAPWRRVAFGTIGCCGSLDSLAADDLTVVDLPIRGLRSPRNSFEFRFNQSDMDRLTKPAGSPETAAPETKQPPPTPPK